MVSRKTFDAVMAQIHSGVVYREYLKIRAEEPHLPAARALDWARIRVTPKPTTHDTNYQGTPHRDEWVERDGLEVQLKIDCDEYYDGEFSFGNTDKPGAVKRNPRTLDRHDYKFFYPETTYEDHRSSLRAMGFGKHEADCLARKYVHAELERAENCGRTWNFLDWQVEIRYKGQLIEEDGCGGVESDFGEEYIMDLVNHAIKRAREELAAIKMREQKMKQMKKLARELGYKVVSATKFSRTLITAE